MLFLRKIFGSIDQRYLVRSYLIAAALLVYALWYFSNQDSLTGARKAMMYAYAFLSAVLFPFAKLVWDETKALIMGDFSIVSIGWWAIAVDLLFKALVNVVLWFFAIVVAPLGILYLWFRARSAESEPHS